MKTKKKAAKTKAGGMRQVLHTVDSGAIIVCHDVASGETDLLMVKLSVLSTPCTVTLL